MLQETGVQIFAEAEGTWQLFAPNPDSMAEAETIIENILAEEKVPELEFGGKEYQEPPPPTTGLVQR